MKKIFTLAATLLLCCGLFAQQLNNAGFENWTTAGNGTSTPDNWSSWEKAIGAPLGLATKDTADKKEGLASIKIKTDSIQAGPSKRLIPGFVHYGSVAYAPPAPLQFLESAFAYKPDTIFFWYKYAPAGNDTALINLTASGPSGSLLNGGFLLTGTAGLWLQTYAVLTPNYAAGTVDSFSVMFSSSKGGGVKGSVLHVDGVRFGYKTTTAINAVADNIRLELFPNPVSDVLTIVADTDAKDMTFELLDVTGKVVATKALDGIKSTIACNDFEVGTYFYRVSSVSGTVKNGTVTIVR
ncbi:MAG: T9SS type A sorting domain-containing protein [Chitinophagales bacterium]|nr:T9SS type A sorting domain-containing protein [Chitinophagales bacterium]